MEQTHVHNKTYLQLQCCTVKYVTKINKVESFYEKKSVLPHLHSLCCNQITTYIKSPVVLHCCSANYKEVSYRKKRNHPIPKLVQ